MRIFLSYASQDRDAARAIERDLSEQGHDVFFDRDDLPPGEEYHTRIRQAIEKSHLILFLISPDAVDDGSYTLTELEIAERSSKRASGRLLPVMLRPTPTTTIPHFVRSVTFLDTKGNVPASVAATVHRIASARKKRVYGGVAIGLAAVALVGLLASGLGDETPPPEIVAEDGAPPPEIVAVDGAPAVLIPAGVFIMGDNEESPQRDVHVDTYYIDQYEVTTGRYSRFLAASSSVSPPDEWEYLSLPIGEDLPVVGVDWNDAASYCAWAGRRLPTEAEWEKAARGTDGRRYPWGDLSPTLDHANYENASPLAYDGGLMAVGSHRAGDSPFGVSDMAGNAAEWVADWYSASFVSGDVRNPVGPASGESKVVRGGGRFDPGERISSTKRYYGGPDLRSEDIGFRCARDAE